jgi:endoglucanase
MLQKSFTKKVNSLFITFRLKALIVIPTILLLLNLSSVQASYIHAKGSKLYNDNNEEVRLTGVNWFGFETSNMGPHGLWARDYHGILIQIKQLGFNCIRMPFCNAMLRDGAEVNSINFYGTDPYYPRADTLMNIELKGLSPLQMLDKIIGYAKELGLVIILDNHSREPDGYMNEKLWYTDKTSEQLWIDDWVMLAGRYKNNPTVIGVDLDNEPHGKAADGGSIWGTGDTLHDWNTAAQKCGNAILAANPDLLIIVEGVEQYVSTTYWWGGNLRGVSTYPITLTNKEKLMYSAHEYGPEVFQQTWFDDSSFPDNMESIWNAAFGYIVKDNTAPILIGEFGIKDTSSYSGKAGTWFKNLLEYMSKLSYSWTFWCFNPNSGDTGGLLSYDWLTVEQWKVDALKTYCAPLINSTSSTKQRIVLTSKAVHSLVMKKNAIKYNGKSTGNIKVDIINLNGKVIRSEISFPVNVAHVASGVYTAVLYRNAQIVDKLQFTRY